MFSIVLFDKQKNLNLTCTELETLLFAASYYTDSLQLPYISSINLFGIHEDALLCRETPWCRNIVTPFVPRQLCVNSERL